MDTIEYITEDVPPAWSMEEKTHLAINISISQSTGESQSTDWILLAYTKLQNPDQIHTQFRLL